MNTHFLTTLSYLVQHSILVFFDHFSFLTFFNELRCIPLAKSESHSVYSRKCNKSHGFNIEVLHSSLSKFGYKKEKGIESLSTLVPFVSLGLPFYIVIVRKSPQSSFEFISIELKSDHSCTTT